MTLSLMPAGATKVITRDLFKAYLQCHTKAFLRAREVPGARNVYADWVERDAETYRAAQCARRGGAERRSGLEGCSQDGEVALDVYARSGNLESNIHAVQRVSVRSLRDLQQFVPIRFIPANSPTNLDRFLLAFDALVLSGMTETPVTFGRIVHGKDAESVRIRTNGLSDEVMKRIDELSKLLDVQVPPDLVLNRHCSECEFQALCRQKAVEIDDLSLFTGMSAQERLRHRSKGIFAVHQLSYTFRPRRPSKRGKALTQVHSFPLQARAIREKTVYVHGDPQLPKPTSSIYLDIEGLSSSGPYYLAGVLIVSQESEQFHSFWAEEERDAVPAFEQLVDLVSRLSDFRVFHYGSYDLTALKLMRPKLPDSTAAKMDALLGQTVNVLSIVHHHVYFPSYSNGLKEIARILGCQPSTEIQNGLQSIVWRRLWEAQRSPERKEALLRYNRDDCFYLRRLCEFIWSLQEPTTSAEARDMSISRVDALVPEEQFRVTFKSKTFALSDFEKVTKCAYFDYHRDKVLFRTHPHLRPAGKTALRINTDRLHPNRSVLLESRSCPNCGSRRIEKKALVHYFSIDLKFTKGGVKKFITRFSSWRCLCLKCSIPFSAGNSRGNPVRFGRALKVWCVYWSVVRGLQLDRVRRSLQDLFGLSIQTSYLCKFKRSLSQEYRGLYNEIRQHVLASPVLFVDETAIWLASGKKVYVWVFATLDAVFFLYRPSREGEFLTEMLQSFKGVLVTDFYPVYDSLPCTQQKCLVHFVRDLDDDLLKNPLDQELRKIAQGFGAFLKEVITAVDRFGLKKRHLSKYRKALDRFLGSLRLEKITSGVAISYRQRLEKSGSKMFTFLDYDGIPWHNNYAEHAIKRFAKYRRVVNGLVTEESLKEALVLGSIFNTCELNNVNALGFLLSGSQTLDALVSRAKGRTKVRRGSNSSENQAASRAQKTNQSPDCVIVHLNCKDPNWKESCLEHLKLRHGVEITDFDADEGREWCSYRAKKYGAKYSVRKRQRWARFIFER